MAIAMVWIIIGLTVAAFVIGQTAKRGLIVGNVLTIITWIYGVAAFLGGAYFVYLLTQHAFAQPMLIQVIAIGFGGVLSTMAFLMMMYSASAEG